jgi:tetratricopeptide (TPR) repeat protein
VALFGAALPAMTLTSLKIFPYRFSGARGEFNATPRGLESVLMSAREVEFELIRVASLLESDPSAAAREAARILRSHPGHAAALLLLATAHRACGNSQAAVTELAELTAAQPDSPVICLERGRALRAAGRDEEAHLALERAAQLAPDLAEVWRELSLLHAARGDSAACDAAYARFERLAPEGARLAEAAAALANERFTAAEALLKRALKHSPQDVVALRMLAEAASAREDFGRAKLLLEQCLQLAPGYSRARQDLVQVLQKQLQAEPMLPLLERLLATAPDNLRYRMLHAAAYSLLGRSDHATQILAALLREFPDNELVWLNYGHTLRAAGRQREAVDAYRKAAEIKPQFGNAWLALANLKTFRFTDTDVAAMHTQLAGEELLDDARSQFEFALGKALEDAGEFAASYEHYARGNALRRAVVNYRGESVTRLVQRTRALYTPEFFAARTGWGCPSQDPIFIVGLPRAGSTLLEQILASHSQVEGTRELADVIGLAVELGDREEDPDKPPGYPQSVAPLTCSELAALGERYLAQTRAHRILGRPRFVDKMGSNFVHLGLIHLMLPNARIIDARRSPLGCCFANFKQHFQKGLWFSYSLEDLGHYYRDYASLMAHFDAVLPGRIHRVHYEDVVRDLEGEVRRLLDYCGLPFEEQCLRFHETRRNVATISSEQVRRPLYRDAIEQWRNFEPWLGPLKEALGELAAADVGNGHGRAPSA